jgi:FGGY family of carbohydrate kinases, C-terminal domain
MAEHGVPVDRVINAGGVPRRSGMLNRVYANVLGAPVLGPEGDTTSLGPAIFAFLAAETFRSVEEAQAALCPAYVTVEPDSRSAALCEELFGLFRTLYLSLGREGSEAVRPGGVCRRSDVSPRRRRRRPDPVRGGGRWRTAARPSRFPCATGSPEPSRTMRLARFGRIARSVGGSR